MDRREFLALGGLGMGVVAGCNGRPPSATDTARADETSPAAGGPTSAGRAPVLDRVALRPTDDAGEIAFAVRASDDAAIASFEVTSPTDSVSRTVPDRPTIEATGTVGAPPGRWSPVAVEVTDVAGTTSRHDRKGYARRYPVFEPASYDIGAVYHPGLEGVGWDDCFDGRPAVGAYDAPPGDEVLATQVDQAQGFGLTRWTVPVAGADDVDRFRRVAERPLARGFALELAYNPEPALTGSTSVRGQLPALRAAIEATPTYATVDGRPVVTVGTGAEILVDFDAAREEYVPAPPVADAFDPPEAFVSALREGLRLDDGTAPYLVGKVAVGGWNRTELSAAYRRFAGGFDAVFDAPWIPGGEVVTWRDAMAVNAEKIRSQWRLADELGVALEPVVFPGWDPRADECEETLAAVPRAPVHLAELLQFAGVVTTTGRITLDSFNGWRDGTQIEPGRLRGESYDTAYLEAVSSFQSSTATDRSTYYVGPDGSNANPGSERRPLATIGHAILRADPGDTVRVLPGDYFEFVETVRAGEPGAPITITGPADAVLRGDPDRNLIVRIRHSHVHLTGLTVDGLHDPEAPDDAASYNRGQLVIARPPTTTDDYLEDVVIAPHGIGNTGREMVSLERTRDAEVGPFRVIGPAGTEYRLTDEPGHNGEIVYLGTSPDNLGSDWHPWTDYDGTHDVRVHHVDNSAGHGHSEFVQMKPGVHDVTVEYCTDGGGSHNTEGYSSASVRFNSYDGTVRWCDLRNGTGNGVEIGSTVARDADRTRADLVELERRGGTGHAVYGNRITGFGDRAVAFPIESQTQADQRHVCGNVVDGATDGDPDAPCPDGVPAGDGVGHLGGDTPWG